MADDVLPQDVVDRLRPHVGLVSWLRGLGVGDDAVPMERKRYVKLSRQIDRWIDGRIDGLIQWIDGWIDGWNGIS